MTERRYIDDFGVVHIGAVQIGGRRSRSRTACWLRIVGYLDQVPDVRVLAPEEEAPITCLICLG